MTFQPSQECDRFVTVDVTRFQRLEGRPKRADLVAMNIQRGRDHGLPGYNEFRAACGMEPACSWEDRPDEISRDNWQKLKTVYQHPGDADLFTAGLAEHPFEGGVVGRTFNCIISKQFQAIKEGDR